MAKRVKKIIKVIIPAGKANPSPPLGPMLSQAQVNIKDFCDQFNNRTAKNAGLLTPVEIMVYDDKTFSFILKSPPASELIRKILKIKKGSGKPNLEKIGKITNEQLQEIAKQKMADLNTTNIDQAVKIIKGTARQMGIQYDES